MLMRGFSGASRVQRVFQWNLNETKRKLCVTKHVTMILKYGCVS